MRNHTTHTRDAALRRLSHVNRWLVAGSVVLTGVLADVAANAFPGKHKASTSTSGAKRSSTQTKTSTSSGSGSLSSPKAAPEPQQLQLGQSEALRFLRQRSLERRKLRRQLLERRILGQRLRGQRILERRILVERIVRLDRIVRLQRIVRLELGILQRRLRRILGGGHLGEVLAVLGDRRIHLQAGARGRRLAGARHDASCCVSASRGALAQAEAVVRRELEAIDRACSRFREDSELTALNRRAGPATRVSPLLREALALALRAAALTDGDVDPTIGRALELAGYDRDFELLEPGRARRARRRTCAAGPRVRVRSLPGWQAVRLVAQTGSVRLPARGQPRPRRERQSVGRRPRRGRRGASAVRLRGARRASAATSPPPATRRRAAGRSSSPTTTAATPQRPARRSRSARGGLATSSTAVRRWSHGGRAMHHIIDPASGEPVRATWRTVSVAAGSCADANIAATAAIVRGGAPRPWLDAARAARRAWWAGTGPSRSSRGGRR